MPARRSYYVWQAEGRPVSVHLNLDVIDRLNDLSWREPQSAVGRPVESGGILLGTIQRGAGDNWVVRIDNFELFPSEHTRGPSFSLSGWDRKRLARRLDHFKARKNYTVVGYFRDHTRPGLYVDEDDFSVISSQFPEPWSVVLLIRPDPKEASVGGFFFWEEGDMRRHSSYLQFPFDRGQLESGDFAILTAEPPQERGRVFPARGFKVKLQFAPRWLWAPLVAAGLIVVPAVWYLIAGKSPASINAPAELGLRATRDGDNWRISWSRNLSFIQRADRAALWISDAGRRVRLDLDRNQLGTGSVAYWPLSNDVSFRLEISAGNHKVSETLRTLAPAPQTAAGIDLKGGAQPQTAAAQHAATPPKRELPSPESSSVSPTNTRTKQRPTPSSDSTPAPPKRQTEIAAKTGTTKGESADREIRQPDQVGRSGETSVTRSEPPPELITPAPPVIVSPGPSPERKVEGPARAEKAERRPESLAALRAERRLNHPSPGVEVTVEPVSPSAFRRAINKVPVLRALQRRGYKAGERFVPARPVRKVAPAAPAELVRELPGEAPIDLKLSIDRSGRVSRTELVSDKADKQLLTLAEDAAKHWEFEPARLDDDPVSSEVVLHFKFGNPSGQSP